MAKMPFNFNIDLKKLSKESLKSVDQLSKQFVTYEKRVKKLVHEMDVSTRDARQQGRERLDSFLKELRVRRDALEQKVAELVHLEGKRINEGVNELVTYLKQLRASGASSGAASKKASAKAAPAAATAKASKAPQTPKAPQAPQAPQTPTSKGSAAKSATKAKSAAGTKKAAGAPKSRRKASTSEASPTPSM